MTTERRTAIQAPQCAHLHVCGCHFLCNFARHQVIACYTSSNLHAIDERYRCQLGCAALSMTKMVPHNGQIKPACAYTYLALPTTGVGSLGPLSGRKGSRQKRTLNTLHPEPKDSLATQAQALAPQLLVAQPGKRVSVARCTGKKS